MASYEACVEMAKAFALQKQVRTTRKTGGLLCPYKGLMLAAP